MSLPQLNIMAKKTATTAATQDPTQEEREKELIELQQRLMNKPPATPAEEAVLIKWIEDLNVLAKNIFHGIIPTAAWAGYSNGAVDIELLGAQDRPPPLFDGVYLLKLPAGVDESLRDPLALAWAHLGKAPPPDASGVPTLRHIPILTTITLNTPTQHERIGAMQWMIEFAKAHENDPDITEWASMLVPK